MQQRRRPGRPLGEIAEAMLQAAQRPGTAVELAARCQASVRVARYTASRLLSRGQLVIHAPGRPAMLVAAAAPEAEGRAPELASVVNLWAGTGAAPE